MTKRTLKQGLLALPGIGASLLPKVACPLCWPAYAGACLALWGSLSCCPALTCFH
jgi:hypothetical protein